jgi:archaellum component FlaC
MPENGNGEVLEAIQELATHVDKRLDSVEKCMESGFAEVRQEFRDVRHEIRQVDERVMQVNDKVDLLAVKLMDKEVISKTDAAEVMRFEAN